MLFSIAVSLFPASLVLQSPFLQHGHGTVSDTVVREKEQKGLSDSFLELFCSKDMRYDVQFRSKSAVSQHHNFNCIPVRKFLKPETYTSSINKN